MVQLPISDCYVYFVEAVGLNRVKIGSTKTDPFIRLSQLQVGCPVRLRLLTAQSGGRNLERWLHDGFSQSRIVGEWFHLTTQIQSYIDGVVKENDELWNTFAQRPDVLAVYLQTHKGEFPCGKSETRA